MQRMDRYWLTGNSFDYDKMQYGGRLQFFKPFFAISREWIEMFQPDFAGTYVLECWK